MTENELNLQIATKLDELQAALLSTNPSMPTLLRDIHNSLKAMPEQVTLLSEDQIHIIIQGLESYTNTTIAQSLSKPSKALKKSLKNAAASDFGF